MSRRKADFQFRAALPIIQNSLLSAPLPLSLGTYLAPSGRGRASGPIHTIFPSLKLPPTLPTLNKREISAYVFLMTPLAGAARVGDTPLLKKAAPGSSNYFVRMHVDLTSVELTNCVKNRSRLIRYFDGSSPDISFHVSSYLRTFRSRRFFDRDEDDIVRIIPVSFKIFLLFFLSCIGMHIAMMNIEDK